MSVFGGYGPSGDRDLPRVLRFTVRPADAGAGRFECSLHEEGTGIRLEYPARISAAAERRLVEDARILAEWSAGRGPSASAARRAFDAVGRRLHRSFLGRRGAELLARMRPSALLMDIDERILSLPW